MYAIFGFIKRITHLCIISCLNLKF